jgi:hypothetical protein
LAPSHEVNQRLNTSSPAVVFRQNVATSSSDHVVTKFR